MSRPSIKSPCVADRHHGPGERIAEFSIPAGHVGATPTRPQVGGLLALQRLNDGTPRLAAYRCDPGIVYAIPTHGSALQIGGRCVEVLGLERAFHTPDVWATVRDHAGRVLGTLKFHPEPSEG